jgi:Tfp pilus assembly protein PilO
MTISSRNKILLLILYLLIITLILVMYQTKRMHANTALKAEMQRARGEMAEIHKTLAEMDDARRRFRHETHIMVFVESLYRAADENRLAFHEVTSDSAGSAPAMEGKDTFITGSKFRISVKGDSRAVVEYVRSIMNLQQFSRINELKIAAEQKGVTGTINLEIFTFR